MRIHWKVWFLNMIYITVCHRKARSIFYVFLAFSVYATYVVVYSKHKEIRFHYFKIFLRKTLIWPVIKCYFLSKIYLIYSLNTQLFNTADGVNDVLKHDSFPDYTILTLVTWMFGYTLAKTKLFIKSKMYITWMSHILIIEMPLYVKKLWSIKYKWHIIADLFVWFHHRIFTYACHYLASLS